MTDTFAPPARLCVDIDNVVARSDEVMRAIIRRYTGGAVDLHYEHITTFNYYECFDASKACISKSDWKVVHDLFAEPGSIRSVEPMPYVQGALRELSESFSIHFATSRLQKARGPTIRWFEENGFDFSYDLHFVRHGEKHTSLGRFAGAVEDDLDQALAFAADPESHSFVLDHPWNQLDDPPGNLHRVADWRDLTHRLRALAS